MSRLCTLRNSPLEIWKDNLWLRDGLDSQQLLVTGVTVRDLYADHWRLFPTVSDTFPMVVRSRTWSDSGTLAVVDPLTGASPARSCVFVGDSITATAGGFPALVKSSIAAKGATLTLLGTKGVAPNKTEAVAGATFRRAATDPAYSSMVDGSGNLDIPAYLVLIGATPDFIVWGDGTNDVYGSLSGDIVAGINSAFDAFDGMRQAWDASAPSVKHFLLTAWPGNIRNSPWLTLSGGLVTRWQWRSAYQTYLEMLYARYSGREAERIFVVASHLQMDPWRSYPVADTVHFDTITGHPYAARTIEAALTANW